MWASNLSLEKRTPDVVLKAWDVVSGKETFSKTLHNGYVLEPNRSVEITEFEVPVEKQDNGQEARIVVAAFLFENGTQVARYVNWPEPLKYTHLQKPQKLEVKLSAGATKVEISAEVPVKGVALYAEDDEIVFEDNCVDIVPGEVVSIGVRGLREGEEEKLSVRYLN